MRCITRNPAHNIYSLARLGEHAHGPRLAEQLRAAHEEVAALAAEAEAQQRLAHFDGHLRAGASDRGWDWLLAGVVLCTAFVSRGIYRMQAALTALCCIRAATEAACECSSHASHVHLCACMQIALHIQGLGPAYNDCVNEDVRHVAGAGAFSEAAWCLLELSL